MYIISLSTLEYHQTLLDSKSCKKKNAEDGKGAYNTTISFGKDLLSNGGKMSLINLLFRKRRGGGDCTFKQTLTLTRPSKG